LFVCQVQPLSKYSGGRITDGADQADIEMARGYLRECYSDGQIEQQFARMRTAAERLVRTPSVRRQIEIADVLMRQVQ
jgi:hypothetical protein